MELSPNLSGHVVFAYPLADFSKVYKNRHLEDFKLIANADVLIGLKKSQLVWILMAKKSFIKTCKLRNLLKIGL